MLPQKTKGPESPRGPSSLPGSCPPDQVQRDSGRCQPPPSVSTGRGTSLTPAAARPDYFFAVAFFRATFGALGFFVDLVPVRFVGFFATM